MGGDRVSTGNLLTPNVASSIETWLHSLSCWPRDSYGYKQTTEAVSQTMGCSLPTDIGALFPRKRLTQII